MVEGCFYALTPYLDDLYLEPRAADRSRLGPPTAPLLGLPQDAHCPCRGAFHDGEVSEMAGNCPNDERFCLISRNMNVSRFTSDLDPS